MDENSNTIEVFARYALTGSKVQPALLPPDNYQLY